MNFYDAKPWLCVMEMRPMTLRPMAWLSSCTMLTMLLLLGCPAPSVDDETTATGMPGSDTGTTTTFGMPSSGEPDPSVGSSGGSTGPAPTSLDDTSETGLPPTGGGMCNPQAQDCPEGEKCTFYRDDANPGGANKCVPVVGDGQIGDPCMALDSDTDSCALGLLCWGTEPDNATGSCTEMCNEAEECSSGDPCTITNGGALPLCLPKCDPLAPVCPAGWACYDDWEFSDNWFCDRDKSGKLGQHGDPCETIAGCDPGLICAVADTVDSQTCIRSGAGGCCTPVCDLTDPIMCPGPTEECISKYEGPPPPEYMDVGQCAIPQ